MSEQGAVSESLSAAFSLARSERWFCGLEWPEKRDGEPGTDVLIQPSLLR